MTYNFRDYQNQPILLTDDSEEMDTVRIPPKAGDLMEKALHISKKKDKLGEKKLKEWIEQYPGVPHFKNFLSYYYDLIGQREKAFEYNHLIAEQHPDYLFAKLNLAREYIFRKEFERVPQILGNALKLQALYPNRRVFHFTEYSNFYKTVLKYLAAIEQFDRALPILESLEKLEQVMDVDLQLYELQKMKLLPGLKKIIDEAEKRKNKKVVQREQPTLPQTEEAPKFHFDQVKWLYENSFKIAKTKVKELLSLERAPLVNDLSLVIYDSIRRYKFFWEKDYRNETHDFTLHALLLLQELKDPEGLPAVLEFLRQPEELLEYWLSDFLNENMWEVLYNMGQDRLPMLEDFLKEPLNYTYARTAASTAISQVALHQPQRREEVLAVYRSLLNFYYENRDNPEVLDPTVTGFLVNDILEIKGVELLKEIKQLYDAQAIDDDINGDWNDIEEELNDPDKGRMEEAIRKLETIYEVIDEIHRVELDWEKEELIEEKEEMIRKRDLLTNQVNLAESEANKEKGTVFYSSDRPYKKDEPKVGRNDPCPCGSGLKYKKCHGKNE